MPLTVITLKNVPVSLRGDLTKWMQEIATGIYVGNFNTKIRQQLWQRVVENVGDGEATITYQCRNEIGYAFDTVNAQRRVENFDGIPLVMLPNKERAEENNYNSGYSTVARYRKARKFSRNLHKSDVKPYVVLDIETDGLDGNKNSIIEIGAIKISGNEVEEFSYLIAYDGDLSIDITKLTGITKQEIIENGVPLEEALEKLLIFIMGCDLVGYNFDFDLRFLNNNLQKLGLKPIANQSYDLLKFVKSEKLFLSNYKLQTVLQVYEINHTVPHRALEDAKLIYELSTKVNKFVKMLERK